jgi:hypothetical protein
MDKLVEVQFFPCIDGSFQVFLRVSTNGVALKSDISFEANLMKHLQEGPVIEITLIERLN